MRTALSAALLAIVACGGGSAAAPPASTPNVIPKAEAPPAPSANVTPTPKSEEPAAAATADAPAAQPLPVVPLRLVSTEPATRGEVWFELKADGTLSDKDGPVGKIDGRRVLVGDMAFYTVDDDGKVTFAPAPDLAMHFDADDALVLQTGAKSAKLLVDDTGHATMTAGAKTEALPLTIEGASRAGRRAAELLALSTTIRKK